MGKFFNWLLGLKDEQLDIDAVMKKADDLDEETNKTLTEVRATLNGEDEWFTRLEDCVKECVTNVD